MPHPLTTLVSGPVDGAAQARGCAVAPSQERGWVSPQAGAPTG
jgi:hypothetical protein